MCLIVFDWRPDVAQGVLFTLAANRDEYFRRATEPLEWWRDTPRVLAGRDLEGGGTWLGVSRDGRFAALTNYRAPREVRPDAPTRGKLVADFLGGEPMAPLEYLTRVAERGAVYNGFNLLAGDFNRRELGWYCNRGDLPPSLLSPGTHGISNAVLDAPWPKLRCKRAELAALVAERGGDVPLASLIAMMRDTSVAGDDELPFTGVPLEWERALSAAFIETPEYGTRGSTALRVRDSGGKLGFDILEISDDDGSHRLRRPGDVERKFAFDAEPSR